MLKKDTIVIDENIPIIDVILSDYHNIIKVPGREITNQLLKTTNANFLICRSQTKVNENLLTGTYIRFVATATSGSDHIDTNFLLQSGITFHSAIGSNATSVAEYVIFSILHWSKLNHISLQNTTIGIIGFGNIGQRLADFGEKIGLKIIVNDPPLRKSGFSFPNYTTYSEIEDLFTTCNIITNHVPLTQNCEFPTSNLINSDLIAKLRDNALFIHTSRGGVVDEAALKQIKNEKNITFVIDVWESEPNFDSELAEKCLIATPHIAGYSFDGKLNGSLMMLKALSSHTGIEYDLKLLSKAISNDIKTSIARLNQKELYEKMDESRAFLRDKEIFAKTFAEDREGKARMFDEIRKNYPARRELLISDFDKLTISQR
ncbi:MAG: 4-phosphoerythronate dehydrogenase [Desulfobulbaceae bacterium]|nr:4-phosphoerythronate dehydrogenase [Candidatus Kapabacteria bacterium]MBS4001659.1 4-phosphoerythronate dehydrogenase [Desulfobulbaceae bacterium]